MSKALKLKDDVPDRPPKRRHHKHFQSPICRACKGLGLVSYSARRLNSADELKALSTIEHRGVDPQPLERSVSGLGGKMGTVIRFPRVCELRETAARTAGDSAEIIILPVVRIERMLEAQPDAKARVAKSVTKSATKSAVKSAAGRKRAVPALRAPACGRG